MKTSQLIEKLQKAMAEHGDLNVCFKDFTDGGYVDIVHIETVSPAYPWKAGQYGVDDLDAGPVFIQLDQ